MGMWDSIAFDDEIGISAETAPHAARARGGFKAQAMNSAQSNRRDTELEEKYEEEIARKTAKREERIANRKEALREAGEDLKALAKLTGKGLKETARIVYNLSLGKAVERKG